jgi:hypothetical protein
MMAVIDGRDKGGEALLRRRVHVGAFGDEFLHALEAASLDFLHEALGGHPCRGKRHDQHQDHESVCSYSHDGTTSSQHVFRHWVLDETILFYTLPGFFYKEALERHVSETFRCRILDMDMSAPGARRRTLLAKMRFGDFERRRRACALKGISQSVRSVSRRPCLFKEAGLPIY